MRALKPGPVRAVVGAAIGAVIGAGSLILAGIVGMEITDGEILGLGYLLALIGFLFGIGAFRFWLTWAVGREVNVEEEHAAHGTAGDWRRYFLFTTDHKVIGVQYLATAFTLFLVAGSAAMLMRFELAQPGLVLGKEAYNEIFSTHGAMMITVALISIVGGRFGISSAWIGGRCAPTQTMTPTSAIAAHSPSTTPQ